MTKRGTRQIHMVLPPNPSAVWVWVLTCGHQLTRKAAPRTGQVSAICPTCRTMPSARQTRAWRKRRRAGGRCWDCEALAVPGNSRCAEHLADAKVASDKHKAALRVR
jgi:hypothetical protein